MRECEEQYIRRWICRLCLSVVENLLVWGGRERKNRKDRS